jgi:hypothetical protein
MQTAISCWVCSGLNQCSKLSPQMALSCRNPSVFSLMQFHPCNKQKQYTQSPTHWSVIICVLIFGLTWICTSKKLLFLVQWSTVLPPYCSFTLKKLFQYIGCIFLKIYYHTTWLCLTVATLSLPSQNLVCMCLSAGSKAGRRIHTHT